MVCINVAFVVVVVIVIIVYLQILENDDSIEQQTSEKETVNLQQLETESKKGKCCN